MCKVFGVERSLVGFKDWEELGMVGVVDREIVGKYDGKRKGWKVLSLEFIWELLSLYIVNKYRDLDTFDKGEKEEERKKRI